MSAAIAEAGQPSAEFKRGRRAWWSKSADLTDRELWAEFARLEHCESEYSQGALAAVQGEIDHRDCYY